MAGMWRKSATKGALMGIPLTGGWLLADLLLPEPWGDYALFSAMAIVNIAIGWTIGKLYDAHDGKETTGTPETDNGTPVEVRP